MNHKISKKEEIVSRKDKHFPDVPKNSLEIIKKDKK